MDFLTSTIFAGNTLLEWSTAVGIALLSLLLLWGVGGALRGRLARLVQRTFITWDDVMIAAISRTKPLVLLIVALYIGSLTLTLPSGVTDVATGIVIIVLLIQAGIWSTTAVKLFFEHYARERQEDGATVTAMSGVGVIVRIGLWVVVGLLALDNLGVNITALVAGLGVGGIAVALALQNILGDLFASLTIVLDKPFVIGDFIIVGDLMGVVEHVGLKTTRIRSLSGEQLVFSNGDLLGSRIRNYGPMEHRRVAFTIGVTYDTPRERLEAIPQMIREAVEAQEHTRFDRCHFKEYGDFSIHYETVYYVLQADYNLYMDIQQAINLRIHERFEQNEIDFAFPTQTIHLAGKSG